MTLCAYIICFHLELSILSLETSMKKNYIKFDSLQIQIWREIFIRTKQTLNSNFRS